MLYANTALLKYIANFFVGRSQILIKGESYES